MQPNVIPGHSGKMETVETTTRVFNRRPARKEIDFDIAFLDEDDGNHEQSHVEMMRQQKETFERQRQQHTDLGSLALSTGGLLFARMVQCDQATRWVKRMAHVSVKQKDKMKKEEEHIDDEVESRFGS